MKRLENEPEVRALFERGRAAHPKVALPFVSFCQHLGTTNAVTEGLHAEDFFLAAACARSDPGALAELDATFLAAVPGFVSRLGVHGTAADELVQQLRELLFAPAAGAPRISEYRGRGSLGGWLRVTAVRLALKTRRREQESPGSVPAPCSRPSPEVDLLREKYREEFEAACAEVVRKLESRDRRLLQLHYLEGLSLDEVASRERVHRATAARWLAAARSAIRHETRRRVAEKLDLGPASLSSVGRWVEGELKVSLRRLLADPA